MSNAKKSLFASVLLIANSLANKLVGLLSTLILARILAPEDFGLVAITTLVLGFVSVFATTGSQAYIFQKEYVDDDVLNTAWTLDLILRILVSILMFISAPYISQYYGNEELTLALQIVAFHPFIQALTNPGIWLLQKEQNFGSYVKQSIAIKIITVIVTVSAAFTLKNYWALIIGVSTSQILGAIGGYFLHPHRPKFCLTCIKEQFAFSGWLTPTAILGYFRTQLDTFIVSSEFGKAQLGSYHVMKYIAFIPTQEVINPGTQPLLVELAKVKNDKAAFNRQYRLTLATVMLIAMPIAGFLYTFSDIVVELLLGAQWISYADIFAMFAGLIISSALLSQTNRVLTVFEKTKFIFYIETTSFISIYGILWLIGFSDVIGFTQNRVYLELGFAVILFVVISLKYIGGLESLKLGAVQCGIITTTFATGALSKLVSTYIEHLPLLVEFIISGTIYVCVYALIIITLYILVFKNAYEGQYLHNLSVNYLKKLKKT